MNYISLDLEWNQAYAQKALAVQKRLSCRLRGEVIQIGAVKLDEQLNIIGSYRITVKPRFFKNIQRHVARLTGIDQVMADHGTPLPEAIVRFKKWCGEDFAFLTWGPDDIPMLEDNLRAHKLDGEWLHRTYDLQLIFNRQTEKTKHQRSLEFAMEFFGIEQNLPAHDALNDAYFTALVAKRLDVAGGIANYQENSDGEYLFSTVIGDADAGQKGFGKPEDILQTELVTAPTCPTCGTPLTKEGEILHSKGQRYSLLLSCPEHGKLFLRLRVMQNFNESFRARCVIFPSDEEKEADYRRRLTEAESYTRRRRRPSRPRKPKGDAKEGSEKSTPVSSEAE